jgi:hypothetical protein
MRRALKFWFFTSAWLLAACSGSYSFTGGDVGNAKTFSVDFFQNYAPLVNPNLSQQFTEELKDIFVQQTNLKLRPDGGDLQFEGSIVDYNVMPISAQANLSSSQSRLTITVNVIFTNTLDEKKNFEQRFTRFADFSSDQSFSAVEDALVKQINRELAENILNKAIVNW